MRWVADTGPLLHLSEAGAEHLLSLVGDLIVPPAVQAEYSALRATAKPLPALRILSPTPGAMKQAEDWCQAGLVHRGEAHAIALARETGADVLLTDDAAARLLATTVGLRARGSLGVILWLAGQRLISCEEAARHLEGLARSSLWVAAHVMVEARDALNKLSDR